MSTVIMSGSGGYSKYRCKYWASNECDNWVWINGRACVWCIAAGRDEDLQPMQHASSTQQPMFPPREICIPVFQEGQIVYVIMEVLGVDETGKYSLRAKAVQRPVIYVPTTNSMPRAPSTSMATVASGY